ncbi:hypothetical protein ScPMuIL_008817 [Solemya velum]
METSQVDKQSSVPPDGQYRDRKKPTKPTVSIKPKPPLAAKPLPPKKPLILQTRKPVKPVRPPVHSKPTHLTDSFIDNHGNSQRSKCLSNKFAHSPNEQTFENGHKLNKCSAQTTQHVTNFESSTKESTQVFIKTDHEHIHFDHHGNVPCDNVVSSTNRSPDRAHGRITNTQYGGQVNGSEQESLSVECSLENSSNYLDLLSQRSSGCSEETDSQECDQSISSASHQDHCCIQKNSVENYEAALDGYGAYQKSDINVESHSCVHDSDSGTECSFNHLESYSERKVKENKLDRITNWKDRNKSVEFDNQHHILSSGIIHDAGNSEQNENHIVTMRQKQKPIPKKRYSLDKESFEGIYDNSQMSSSSNNERKKSKEQSESNFQTSHVDDSHSSEANSLIFEHLEKMVHQSLLEIEQLDTDEVVEENCSDASKCQGGKQVGSLKPDDHVRFIEEENAKRKDEASEANFENEANPEQNKHSNPDQFKRRSDSFGRAIENGDFTVSGVKKIPPKPERKNHPKTKSKSDITEMIPSDINTKKSPPPLPGRVSSRILRNLQPGLGLPDENMSVLSGYTNDSESQSIEKSSTAVNRTHSAGAIDSRGMPRRPPPDRKPPPLPEVMPHIFKTQSTSVKPVHVGSQRPKRRPSNVPPSPPHKDRNRSARVKKQNNEPSTAVSSDSEGDYSEISEITPSIMMNDEDNNISHGESTVSPPCLPPRNIVSADSTTPQAPPRRKSKGKISSTMLNNELSINQSPMDVLKTQEYSHLHARPDSIASSQSESSHGSQDQDQSLSEPETEDEKAAKASRREKKISYKVQEIASSEEAFVDKLKLLNVDFRVHISQATEYAGKAVIPNEVLNKILEHLPQLQNFNEDLLKDFQNRIANWNDHKKMSDVFVKKGRFLMLYTPYIQNFENTMSLYDEALKKFPAFCTAVREFESTARCASLAVSHYLLKPIQRILQYKLLLQEYAKLLSPECEDHNDTLEAIQIVSRVADHVNESMRQGDTVQKMLEVQQTLVGQFEVVKPGRVLIRKGELMKCSRKEKQPRMFFLFSDVLLYTTPVTAGYKVNTDLPLAGMKLKAQMEDEETSPTQSTKSIEEEKTLRKDGCNQTTQQIDRFPDLREETVEAIAQDIVAKESMAMLGYKINRLTEPLDGVSWELLFEVSHPNTDPMIFRTENSSLTEKWVATMEEASIT